MIAFRVILPLFLFSVPVWAENWKAVPAAILKKIDGVIVYEAHVPTVFEIVLPDAVVNQKSFTDCNQNQKSLDCILDEQIHTLQVQGREDRLDYQESLSRGRRQLGFVAGAAIFLFGATFGHSIFGNDDDVRQGINNANRRLTGTETRLLNVEKLFNNMSTILDGKFMELEQELSTKNLIDAEQNKRIVTLYKLVSANILATQISEAYANCKNNFIPHKMLSNEQLSNTLRKIDEMAVQHGYVLAVPISQIRKYFVMPIASCKFTATSIYVSLRIPLIRRETKPWSVYKIIPTNFAHFKETCTLSFHESDYLLSNDEYSQTIRHDTNEFCDIKITGMCLIVPQTKSAPEVQQCAAGIMKSLPVKELANSCKFDCEKSVGMSYKLVAENRIIFTNVLTLDIICPKSEKKFNFTTNSDLGSVDVQLGCSCKAIADGTEIPPIFPCFEMPRQSNYFSVVRIVPDFWATFDETVGQSASYNLANITQSFNKEWKSSFPKMTITPFDAEPTPFYIHNNLLYFSTAIIVAIVLIFVLVFWNFCKHTKLNNRINDSKV